MQALILDPRQQSSHNTLYTILTSTRKLASVIKTTHCTPHHATYTLLSVKVDQAYLWRLFTAASGYFPDISNHSSFTYRNPIPSSNISLDTHMFQVSIACFQSTQRRRSGKFSDIKVRRCQAACDIESSLGNILHL